MSVATSTAIALVAAGVTAGTTIYAANKASGAQENAATTAAGASKDATAAQMKAAEDALAFEKQVYQQRQQQVSPYIGYGQGALSMLGQGLGVTPTAQPPIPGTGPSIPPGTITNGLPQSITGGNWSPNGPTMGAPNGPPNSSGQMVTMRAPTGQVSQVPAELAQHYQQQGAKLLDASSVQPQGAA